LRSETNLIYSLWLDLLHWHIASTTQLDLS